MSNNTTPTRDRTLTILHMIREAHKQSYVTEICTLTRDVANPYANYTDKRARRWWAQAEVLPAGSRVTLKREDSVSDFLVTALVENMPGLSDEEIAKRLGYRATVTITVECNGGASWGSNYVRYWESAAHDQQTVDLTFDGVKEVDGEVIADDRYSPKEQKASLAQRELILGILAAVATKDESSMSLEDAITKHRTSAHEILEKLIESGAVSMGDVLSAAKR
jgi:hypothetical protein